jgi:carnitine O-acetyltransferase
MVSSNETQAEPFYDPVFVRASKWVVSTGVTARVGGHIDSFGFNAVEPDGFGLMCMCGVVQGTSSRDDAFLVTHSLILTRFSDCMTFTVTSRRDMPNEAFSRHLVNATEDILALFSAPGFPVAKL